jgi:hypothetical protein
MAEQLRGTFEKFVEVRWRSLFRSTSLGKRFTSYNAPPTSRKRRLERERDEDHTTTMFPPLQLGITVTASLCIIAAYCRKSTHFSIGPRITSGSFPGSKAAGAWSWLTTHLCLVLRLRIHGALYLHFLLRLNNVVLNYADNAFMTWYFIKHSDVTLPYMYE